MKRKQAVLMVCLFSNLLLLSACGGGTTPPPEPPPAWTTIQLGSVEDDYAIDVATDASSNNYTAGYSHGSFDGHVHAGGGDIIITKHDKFAVKQWTHQLGTAGGDWAAGIATDINGNVYIAGMARGELDGNSHAGNGDLFIIKYDTTGAKHWTRQFGTPAWDAAYGIATDSSDSIYVVGITEGDLDGHTNAGQRDLFVIKYDSAGTRQWTRLLGTTEWDHALAVTSDSSGNVYVAGETRGDLDGNTNAGYYDLFVVKYDTHGNRQWTRQLGTAEGDSASAIATDVNDNIYVTGRTTGDLDGNTSAGGSDLFVIKYDSQGDRQWLHQFGSASNDTADGIAVDNNGNIYIAGDTDGELDGQANAGGDDLFVVKYDTEGNRYWVRQLGTPADDVAYGVTVDATGNVYAAGSTRGGLDGNSHSGKADLFVVKYDAGGVKQ